MIVAWDGGVPEFRRKLLPSYKANRSHDNDDTFESFIGQLKELSSILPKCGVTQLRRVGIEGDDLAFHASRMLPCDQKALIISGDDDLLQAVNPCNHVLQPGKTELLVTLDNIGEVTGLNPDKVVSQLLYNVVKTLAGDSSDNITGIVGVGLKTAAKIVNGGMWQYNGVCVVPEELDEKWFTKVFDYVESGLYERTFKVVDLTHDRAGARYEVLRSKWQQCNIQSFNAWLMRWGFASLLTMGAATAFARLQQPKLWLGDIKIPLIWSYQRYPC
jgi:5'-3' exonuclease